MSECTFTPKIKGLPQVGRAFWYVQRKLEYISKKMRRKFEENVRNLDDAKKMRRKCEEIPKKIRTMFEENTR